MAGDRTGEEGLDHDFEQHAHGESSLRSIQKHESVCVAL